MYKWIIPEVKKINDIVTPDDSANLFLSIYIEEQDKWSKKMFETEDLILSINNKLNDLSCSDDKWWEKILIKLFNIESKRQKDINETIKEKININKQYDILVNSMPDIDRYELAIYGNNIFKPR